MYRLRSRNSYSPDEVIAAIQDISNSVLFPSLEKNLSRIMKSSTLDPVKLPAIGETSENDGRPSTVPIPSNPSYMLSSKHLEMIVSQDLNSVAFPNRRFSPDELNRNLITRERLRKTLEKMKVSQLISHPFISWFYVIRACSTQKRK